MGGAFMKVFRAIWKILAALAMIAGVIYVLANYGDKISAWARQLMSRLSCCRCCGEDIVVETPAEEVPTEEEAVQADEQDFEG
jgi:hypothetical protein